MGVYVPENGIAQVVGIVPVVGKVDGGKYTATAYISAVDGHLVDLKPAEMRAYNKDGLVNLFNQGLEHTQFSLLSLAN